MNIDILIIGGGLAGLRLADLCHAAGQDFLLVEARDRWGGRILTHLEEGAAFDLGPAWYWPGQPRMGAQVYRFGLQPFDQFSEGQIVFEHPDGRVQSGQGYASMQGSFRVGGGFGALIDALADTLPKQSLRLSAPVMSLRRDKNRIVAATDNGAEISANRVVLALPPRIAAILAMTPALPMEAVKALSAIPTWMAGQAKALAIYDRPFWRDAGFSGDAMSHLGPMVEIHDASPDIGGPYGLFGFIGLPATHRQKVADINGLVMNQLTRIFGPDAARPRKIVIQDWASDPLTATQADQDPVHAHPAYGLPKALAHVWDGRLQFAGTEFAPQFGGYLEGALEAAENVFANLQQQRGRAHAS